MLGPFAPVVGAELGHSRLVGDKLPRVETGEVLVDLVDYRFLVALDRFDEFGAVDGLADEVITFVVSEDLEPLSYEGVGIVRIKADTVLVSLPELRLAYELTVAAGPDGTPASENTALNVVRHRGLALYTWSPPDGEAEPLALAVANALERHQRAATDVTSRVAPIFQQDPSAGGTGSCKKACSADCYDGSKCSASCASGQCAKCTCVPAKCECVSP